MWKGLKVIGIINAIFLILEIVAQTIILLAIIFHIEAIAKYSELEVNNIGGVIIYWILAVFICLVLLYFNFGLINQNTPNIVRDWLISHGIVLFFCLLDIGLRLNRTGYFTTTYTAIVLLVEIIIIILFCYIIPSTSGSNTGNQSAV